MRIFADVYDEIVSVMVVARIYADVLLPLKLREPLTYRVPEGLDLSVGTWVSVPLRGHLALGIVERVCDSAPKGVSLSAIGEVEAMVDKPRVSPEELAFWHAVADYYLCTPGEVFKAAYNAGLQRALLQPETPVRHRKKTAKTDKGEVPGAAEVPEFALKPLSAAQETALERIRAGFAAGKPVLLAGVTGSGKTEIYLHLAAEALRQGRDVLYLVPEIAVSKQLQQRIADVFGDRLLVFHSQTTVPQRYKVINILRRDPTSRIVLGTRSAVFLPMRKLGLVVVDEEHDRSYKQDDMAPRYNGRDAALMLAAQQGASVLLGSATPSYESLYNVQTRKFARVALPDRFHGGDDPEVELIDTTKERRLHNMEGSFSRKLLKEMAAVLEAGNQVLVFRSRRAYAPVVQCDACGETVKCPHCNVTLSYHKFNNMLSCHYCGYHRSFTMRCPSCGEVALVERGAGTEKLEEELQAAFPGHTVARFDADTTQRKTVQDKLIRDFAAGRIDILVGTQMITKGFDFERLSMVVIVSADSLFAVPEFRSDERAYQLITQLMGRTGRRGGRGKIVIQTAQPDHPVLQRLLEPGRPSAQATGLLEERKQFAYPPYVRMISVTVKDRYEGRVWNVCRLIREAAESSGITDIAGPVSPAVDRVADEHVARFWIKLSRSRKMAGVKQDFAGRLEQIERDFKGHTAIIVDVDPL